MAKIYKRESDLKSIHSHTALNREELKNSSLCWCISCLGSFPPSMIDDWTDEGNTAICPFCSVDAIVGNASGFNLTPQLLRTLNKKYFMGYI